MNEEEQFYYQREGFGDPVGGGGFMKAIRTTNELIPMGNQFAQAGAIPFIGTAAGAGTAAVAKGGEGFFGRVASKDAGAFGQIAQGLAGTVGGLIGGGARRREQRAARAELARQREVYEQFQFKDPYTDITNPFEDITINQQEAQFAAQQQQQALGATLGGLQQAAGGSGIGALAQAIAQQQSANLQASAASIGAQEQQAQLARARGQQAAEQLRARGKAYTQEKEFGRVEDLYSTAAARKAAADAARRRATEGLVGGIANLGVGVGRILTAGGK
jgi:hypothetical protein